MMLDLYCILGTMRGRSWSDETIQKALKVRLACGTRGYDVVKELFTPLTSELTLQRRLIDKVPPRQTP